MEIRFAEHGHIRAISLLFEELYEEMAIIRPDYFTAGRADIKLIESAIEDDRQEILVALDHDVVVGLVRIDERDTPSFSPYLFRKYAFITDIIVDSAFRGIDIGTALITEAKKWAKKRALDYLEICVLNENENAVLLYMREEFETVMQTMRYSIS